MVYINPNAISNSGNKKYFTNQKSKISLGILNVLSNANLMTEFLVEQFEEQQKNKIVVNNQTNTNDNSFLTILQNQRNNTKLYQYK